MGLRDWSDQRPGLPELILAQVVPHSVADISGKHCQADTRRSIKPEKINGRTFAFRRFTIVGGSKHPLNVLHMRLIGMFRNCGVRVALLGFLLGGIVKQQSVTVCGLHLESVSK